MKPEIILAVFVVTAASSDSVNKQNNCGTICHFSPPEPYRPVCDNKGGGYDSLKELKCTQCMHPDRNLRLGYLGECHDFNQPADPVACRRCQGDNSPAVPVCDSQGKDHRNYSAFRCAQLCNPRLRVASYGKCRAR